MNNLSNEYILHLQENEFEYLQFKQFNNTGFVKHCITTRKYIKYNETNESFDFGLSKPEKRDQCLKNYNIVFEQLGMNKDFAHSNQVHEDRIEVIDEKSNKNPKNTDGFITNLRGIPLVTYCADCMPLLFIDTNKKVIGNSHSGWRGTAKRIGPKMVLKMIDEFKCNPKDILVGVGPSIGQCCFETDYDVLDTFEKNGQSLSGYFQKNNNKYYINLWKLLNDQLKEIGIQDKNISISGICTKCNNDTLFSYRGDKGKKGSMAAIIQLI